MSAEFFVFLLIVSSARSLTIWEFFIGPRLGSSERIGRNASEARDTEQIVKSYGYRLDTHLVASETGHILTLHRIPRGKRNQNDTNPRPIAFIHHGLFGSSDMWLLRGPRHDLPYILADSGYDVWLFNTRGNYHSRKHKFLDPDKDVIYWNFGIEDIGLYDLPATIDYILNITNQKDLFFLGHSIGSSSGFVLCSLKPEYNKKIRLFLALGPLVNVKHKLNPLHKVLFLLGSALVSFLETKNIYEIVPRRAYISKIVEMACENGSPVQKMCLNSLFSLVGEDITQFNTTFFPRFVQYFPAGTSLKVLENVLQYYLSGDFARNDFGSASMNLQHYNSSIPPTFNLSKVTSPVSLYYSEGDYLVTEEDINDLALQLPNVVGKVKIPYKHFNHIDYVLAINARSLLYERLMSVMDKYR